MRGVPYDVLFFVESPTPKSTDPLPQGKKVFGARRHGLILTYHRGGTREKVLAGAAFWSFGTSKLGFSPLACREIPSMVSGGVLAPHLGKLWPGRFPLPGLQYCSKKADPMVSSPFEGYAPGPTLHAAVFLVRGTVKNTNFLAGAGFHSEV